MSDLFVTTMADPGWQYRDNLRMSQVKRGARDQYKTTMTVEQICALYTPSRVEYQTTFLRGKRATPNYIPGRLCGHDVADTGFLWLWCTAAVLLDGTAVQVCNAWGFEPKQIGIWVKGKIKIFQPRDGAHGNAIDAGLALSALGMGWTLRNVVEFFIIATRGKYAKLVQSHSEPNLILEPDDAIILADKREHSRKPNEIYDKIERVCPGPYLELFSRSGRPGWTSYGDEVGKFDASPVLVDDPKITCPACVTGHCAHHKRPEPLTAHTMLIIDDGAVTEHHDVVEDDGLADQWAWAERLAKP